MTELDFDTLPRRNVGALPLDMQEATLGLHAYAPGLAAYIADRQADICARVFHVVPGQRDAAERVTFWGTHDGTSWLKEVPVRGRTSS